MGTVPDPLRSAKHSLVTPSEEENGLRELQPSKHQCKQASVERNSNGFPFIAKLQPAGDHLFEADIPKSEQPCGYEISQPNMHSPKTFSPSKKGCLAIKESKTSSEQEDEAGSLGAPEGHASATVNDSAAQEANKTGQSSPGEQLCGADESKAHNGASLLSPSKICQVAPVEAAAGNEAASGKELGLLPELEMKAHADINVEPKGTTDAGSRLGATSVPETESKSDHAGTSQPLSSPKPVEEGVPNVTKFKDTGTMTMQPEGRPEDEEGAIRTCQDAEVQAVASVESKSACTSPSIFAAFFKKNMPSQAAQEQEQLHVVYTGAEGEEQSKIGGNVAILVQAAPSTGIMPAVQIHSPAATDIEMGTTKHRDDPSGAHDTAHSTLSSPLVSGIAEQPLAKKTEAQIVHDAKNQDTVPQQPLDSSMLSKTKPVYQINVSLGNEPATLPHSVNSETKLPLCSTLPGSISQPQHPEPLTVGNQQVSPSCCRVSEQDKAGTTAKGRNHEEQQHVKTVSDMDQAISHADVKPKREGVSPKEPQTTIAPVGNQREQKTVAEDSKSTGSFGSRNLVAHSELSQSSAFSRGTKSSSTGKGSKVNPSVTAVQPVPNLEKKKKEPASATEAKVQLKQSKRIRDVVWDEQGMTWEVYGASLDPESLGVAIQNHLQRQIREHEKLIKAQNPQARKSSSSDTSSNKKLKGRQHGVFQSMLQNFRRPNCCVRPAASSVLD